MAHHVARQLGQADLLGRDGQRFFDVDRGYDNGLRIAVVGPVDCRPGLALLCLAEGRALSEFIEHGVDVIRHWYQAQFAVLGVFDHDPALVRADMAPPQAVQLAGPHAGIV